MVAIPRSERVALAFATEMKLIYAPGRILFCVKKVPPPRAISIHLAFLEKVLKQAVHLLHRVFLSIFQQNGQKITPLGVSLEGQDISFGENRGLGNGRGLFLFHHGFNLHCYSGFSLCHEHLSFRSSNLGFQSFHIGFFSGADHGQVIVHKEVKYIVHNLIIHAGSMQKITARKRDEVQGFHHRFRNGEHFRIIAGVGRKILNVKWVPLDEPPPQHRGDLRFQNGDKKTRLFQALFHIVLIDFIPIPKGGVQRH
nr:MAG TPA: hypothetical protein [Caudoviricetes sp.]